MHHFDKHDLTSIKHIYFVLGARRLSETNVGADIAIIQWNTYGTYSTP